MDLGINPETGEVKTGAGYKHNFSAPLILEPCQHLVQSRGGGRMFDRREIWFVMIHGDANGKQNVTKSCNEFK